MGLSSRKSQKGYFSDVSGGMRYPGNLAKGTTVTAGSGVVRSGDRNGRRKKGTHEMQSGLFMERTRGTDESTTREVDTTEGNRKNSKKSGALS